jgi:hypothetical protein
MSSKKQSQDNELKHAATRTVPHNAGALKLPTPTGALLRQADADPVSLTPRNVLQLQRTVGNRAVTRLLGGAARPRVRQARAQSGGERETGAGASSQGSAGLPAGLKAGIENLSGLSMDDVRVHYNSSAPAQVEALAYTRGAEIHLGPGQEKHLAHEAWHVVQQMQGRVQPTIQAAGVAVNDSQELEREADEMGARAGVSQPYSDSQIAKGVRQSGDVRGQSEASRATAATQWKAGAMLYESYAHAAAKGAGGMDASAHRPVQRTAPTPLALGAQVSGSHRPNVVQRIALSNAPHMHAGGAWTPTLDANGRAQKIVATNLKLAAGYASVPAGPFNAPSVNPASWATLQGWNLTHLSGPPNYVRMHLLNDRLGGPGNTTQNLAPGTASLNSSHSAHFEWPAMTYVLNQGLMIDRYEVRIAYNPASPNLVTAPGKTAWRDTIWEIWGEFEYTDAMGIKQKGIYNAEEDTPGLDTLPNWAGH